MEKIFSLPSSFFLGMVIPLNFVHFNFLPSSTSCQWFLCFGTQLRHQTRAPCLRPPRLKKGKRLKCTRSNGIIILRKKLLGKLKIFSKETFLTFLGPIQVSNLFHSFSSCNLGARFLLGGKAVTP